tara:strand:- start:395 stop:2827 length:2433 start_codon:yes stop_codon:yes gene_type:complete
MKKYIVDVEVKTGKSKVNLDKTNKQVKNLDKNVKNVAKSSTSLNDSFAVMPGSIGRIVQSFKALKLALLSSGIGAIVVAVGGLAGLFAAATLKGAEFAKQMSTLKAVLGKEQGTVANMQALSRAAKDLGSTTQFTAKQVGELQTEFAKLGFTTGQILDSTKATLDLAASMEVDLSSAAMLAGSTVNAFGLEAKDTQRVVDVLAKSTSSTALDFSGLTESLKTAAPIAKATGRSIEETAAMLGILANTGLKGSIAGTGLSRVFIDLNKKGIDLKDALEKVKNSSNGLVTATDLVGDKGAKSLLNLASKSEDIDRLTLSFEEASGAAAAMAEVRLDNLAGDTTKLSSAWEGFMLSLEDGEGIFNKMTRISVQFITTLISGITKASAFFGAFLSELNDSLSIWDTLKLSIKGFVDVTILNFLKMKEVISKIPFIGKSIDEKALKESQAATVKSLAETTKQLAYWQDVADKRRSSGLSFYERIQARMKAVAVASEQEITDNHQEEINERETISDEAAENEKSRLASIEKFRQKIKKQQEDFDDTTAEEKLARQKERALKELELLNTTLIEKKELELAINQLYDEKEKELKQQQEDEEWAAFEKKLEIKNKEHEEELKRIEKERVARLDAINADLDTAKKAGAAIQSLGNVVFDNKMKNLKEGSKEEEEMARKQFNFNKGMQLGLAIIDTAKAVTTSLSMAPIAVGPIPNPAGIASLAFAAISGAATIASIASQKFEGGSSSPVRTPKPPGAGGGGGTGIGSQAPDFNVVGQSGFNQVATALGENNNSPVKAFVVSGDVTTAQALDNNIIDTATL